MRWQAEASYMTGIIQDGVGEGFRDATECYRHDSRQEYNHRERLRLFVTS
jgi:hypothetical protein